jgi:hypothetical protein
LIVKDKPKLKDNVKIWCFDKNVIPDYTTFRYIRYGKDSLAEIRYNQLIEGLAYYEQGHNLVTKFGEQVTAENLGGISVGVADWVGVGSGTTPPDEDDLELETPIGDRKQAIDIFAFDGVLHVVVFFGSTEVIGTINEVILATGSTGPNAVARKLTDDPFDKTDERTLVVEWIIEMRGVPEI